MISDIAPPSVTPTTDLASLADANCIVLRIDSQGRLIFINPFGLTFFGYGEAEILGRPAVGTIFPEKSPAGGEQTAGKDTLLSGSNTDAPQINENYRKNGDRVWVLWSNRCYRDAAGKVMEILCIGQDITDRVTIEAGLKAASVQLTTTVHEQNSRLQRANALLRKEVEERKKTQQALKESRDRYRLFSTASTEGILFHDEGIVIEVNAAFAELVECPRDQLIGMNIINHFVAPEDRQRVIRKNAANDDQVYEITGCSATGRTFPVELRSRPGELAGRPCRVVNVRDITLRKKTERQLIQSQKMEAVGTLSSGIAHDFNNLLAGVQGNAEILSNRLPPDSPHQKYLSIISQIVQRGAKLSGQLLGYARGGQTEISVIHLNQLVEEALEMFSHAHRRITIQTRLSPATPVISGDRTQIEQVLLNLMINAAHAMPKGGELSIETTPTVLSDNENRNYETIPGNYAMLSVRDNGYGMDRETCKRIFEPFFSTKEQGQGSGLGLASTYGIVKNHKGYIEVHSEPGIGSLFNVLLPAAAGPEKTVVEPIGPEKTVVAPIGSERGTEKATPTILIVDDDPEFLDLGRQLLDLMGYRAITAGDSAGALARFREQAAVIDMVIMDMIMPGPPVDETIRRLREVDPSARVLLASGYSRHGKVGQELMDSCNGFIQKPFRLAELSAKIREILEIQQDENS